MPACAVTKCLVEILAAPAVNAASDGEVKQLDPERAHLRPPGPRQLYKAEFPIRDRCDRHRPGAIGPPGELHQAGVRRVQQVLGAIGTKVPRRVIVSGGHGHTLLRSSFRG